ncbi:DUF1007 family protein [Pseudooceanicola algae]|uniref:Polyphosphate kinase n=1 Tax=Pseudooceanicola algae TaxID=1537215 RepID=A0A418SH42_9RHOB|nr:DUF1007 family protein [Pseudooceanicola algae]QPM90368.1 hypothetical protein PSAL_016060 [Pseudooceanicola algae]
MRMPLTLTTSLALPLFVPLGAAAHPHIFVSTALHMVISPEQQLTAVEVTWAYDELYTMLVLDELGLDPDYDGVLTEAELETLDGYDLNWMPGFEGDLYLQKDGAPLPLGPPHSLGVALRDGQFVSRHARVLLTPVAADEVSARAYDPGLYTGYDLGGGVTLDQGCQAEITPPVMDTAYEALARKMAEIPADALDYPQVGESFSDEIRLHCEARS